MAPSRDQIPRPAEAFRGTEPEPEPEPEPKPGPEPEPKPGPEPDLRLRCAAYTVLRRYQPSLPPLRLPAEAGAGARAAGALSTCFAAARRLLADAPDEMTLFGDVDLPTTLSPTLAVRLNEVVTKTDATLTADAGADPLGPLFEAASGTGVRKARGQHFTPAPVVALVLALGGAEAAANIIDPTCGTGAFLTRAASDRPGAQLWGCELDPLAARLARINLRRHPNATSGHIHSGDVLALQPGDDLQGHRLPRCETGRRPPRPPAAPL